MDDSITRECDALREEIELCRIQNAALRNQLIAARSALLTIGEVGEKMADYLDRLNEITEVPMANRLSQMWGDAYCVAQAFFED